MNYMNQINMRIYLTNTVEPRYNEPLYNENLGITNDFLYPIISSY